MKANELMIGDWVLAIDTIGAKRCIALILELKDVPYLACGIWGEIHKYELLEPIPLTHTILEKNGFERLGTDYILMNYPFGLTNPSAPDDYKDNYWLRVAAKSVNIKYVHELQHALKLCGIDKEITL